MSSSLAYWSWRDVRRDETTPLAGIVAVLVAVVVILAILPQGFLGGLVVVVLLVGGIAALVGGGSSGPLASILRPKPQVINPGAHWATLGELRRDGWLDPTGWPLGDLESLGGLVRRRVYLPSKRQQENVVVFAATGAGKTAGVLIPALLAESRQPSPRSLIIIDPLGALYDATAPALAQSGHRVLRWNPAKPEATNCRFDPIAYIPPSDSPAYTAACNTTAQIWLAATEGAGRPAPRDPYWPLQSSNLLKGVILHLLNAEADVTLLRVGEYLTSVSAADVEEALRESGQKAASMRASVIASLLKNDKAESGVFGDVKDRFTLIADDGVIKVTTEGELVDFAAFVNQPTAIYLQVAVDYEHLQPLLSVFMATATAQLIRLAEQGRQLPTQVRILGDEVGNLGRIYGLETGLNTLRQFGVGHMLLMQSRAQLTERYGQAVAESIVNGCVTKVCLGGAADADAQWISSRIGYRAEMVEMPTYHDSKTSYSYQRQETPLMDAAKIITMENHLIVSTNRIAPSLLKLAYYFNERQP